MQVHEIYEEAGKYRQLEPQDCFDLIWEVDRDLYETLFLRSKSNNKVLPEKYIFGKDDKKEALIEDRFSKIYIYYILADYDMKVQDYENYAADMAVYNSMYQEYRALHRWNNRQAKDY